MINNYIKNICLIAFALFAPIYLPAGGIQKNLNNLSCFNKAKEIVIDSNCTIYVMPDLYSQKLRHLKTGSTLLILRDWVTPNNVKWLRVQTSTTIFAENSRKPMRGWIRV